MLQPGSQIGRYEIQRRLGRGGMGDVYVARDPSLDRDVAIKVLLGELDADASARFVREARSAAALSHVNIVTIHDVGIDLSQPYIVMELVQGETLAEVIRRKAPAGLGQRLRWLEDLCAGVAYAHGRKVIHRDIKPTNLMVDRVGRLKILDFGIARMMGTAASNATALVGTPGYMAPEQILGGAIDHRSDLFSVGVVCYELLSYTEAFPGDNFAAITHRILHESPRPLPQHVPDLPPELVAAVERALQKSAADRFDDTASLGRAIGLIRRDVERSGSAVTVPGLSHAVSGAPAGPTPKTGREELASRRAAQIAALLDQARALLQRGELDAAREGCLQALAIDDSDAGALDLEQSIKAAFDRQQAEVLVDEARGELTRGALTAAQGLLQQARDLNPQGQDVRRLERDLRLARAAQEEVRQRAEAMKKLCESADQALARGEVEAALASVRQARQIDPASEKALTLESQALKRLNEETGADTDLNLRETLSALRARQVAAAGPGLDKTVVTPRAATPPPVQGKTPLAAPAGAKKPTDGPSPLARFQATVRRQLAEAGLAAASVGSRMAIVASGLSRRIGQRGAVGQAKRGAPPVSKALLAAIDRRVLAWAAGAVVLVALVVAVVMPRPAPLVPAGSLVIDAVPWATVTAIETEDGTAQPLPADASTPLFLTLPVGAYRVRVTGPPPDSQTSVLAVQVTEGGVATAMPPSPFKALTPEDYFEQYLGSPGAEAPADALTTPVAASPGQELVR